MDIVSYILAKNASKGYTDEVFAQVITSLADPYDPTKTYSRGSLVTYNNRIYRALVDIDVPEQFNPEHWETVDLEDEITRLREEIALKYEKPSDGIPKSDFDSSVQASISKADTALQEVLDTTVKLSTELKTYYNIGKIQNASGTNPVVIGHAGDTLRQVFNNLTLMDEEQPTITQAPAITAMSFSSGASDEQGTEITEVNYSLNTREGTYTYGPSPSGVSWSAFGFSGGCVTAEKTTKTGSLTLAEPYIVGESSAVSIACSGTHSAGSIAKTNLGNDSDPVVKIAAGTKTRNGSFSKAAVTYAYSKVVPSTVPPTSGCTKQSPVASFAVNGAEFEYAIGDTIWLLTNKANAKIQTNVLGQWADVTQYYAGTVELTQANGAVRTYHAYRTDVFTGEGSAIYRID